MFNTEFTVCAPSNIALLKYWGKKGTQIPLNPSLSFTLKNAQTKLFVAAKKEKRAEAFSFSFNEKGDDSFKQKIEKIFEHAKRLYPDLDQFYFEFKSENTFPHSAGIASSASSMAAFSIAIHETLFRAGLISKNYQESASTLARLGSGSAARSIYGGFVTWGFHPMLERSSDEFATPLKVHPTFLNICDSVLIVSSKKKSVSSSLGHKLMEDNPYRDVRVMQANKKLSVFKEVLTTGDWKSLMVLCEEESLHLHALMMLSSPSFILLLENSLAIIRKVQEARLNKNIPIFFTIDAGPNIHLLYDKKDQAIVHQFIKDELLSFTENNQVLHDEMGMGPTII